MATHTFPARIRHMTCMFEPYRSGHVNLMIIGFTFMTYKTYTFIFYTFNHDYAGMTLGIVGKGGGGTCKILLLGLLTCHSHALLWDQGVSVWISVSKITNRPLSRSCESMLAELLTAETRPSFNPAQRLPRVMRSKCAGNPDPGQQVDGRQSCFWRA